MSKSVAEILDLRHFSSHDLRALLEQETRVWTESLFWDYRSSADMILRYIDAKILPGYAIVDAGRVKGYCFFVYEGSKGVIGDLFVSAGEGNLTFSREERLLTHALATLQQSPGVHRIEAQLLLHRTGEVSEPFCRHSFRRYPRLFMVLPLAPANASAEPAPPFTSEIELRRWSESDYQAAAAVITTSYRGHIDAEINDQYRTGSGSLRFLNNIVRFPGCGQFDNGSSFVAIHRTTRSMVGLVLCSRVKDDVGHVTQVCVVPGQRGRHIGEALLAAASTELRRRDFSRLTLTVTEANRGAVELYKRLGYRVRHVFDAFVWEG
ncbi:MAG: GNAT family N-acetyltransferase [Terriglobales bacterium]